MADNLPDDFGNLDKSPLLKAAMDYDKHADACIRAFDGVDVGKVLKLKNGLRGIIYDAMSFHEDIGTNKSRAREGELEACLIDEREEEKE